MVIVATIAILTAAGCGPEKTPPPEVDGLPVVVAAGDIADCTTEGDEATAGLSVASMARSSLWATTPTRTGRAKTSPSATIPPGTRSRSAPKRFEWEFVPVEGESFSDSGVAQCH